MPGANPWSTRYEFWRSMPRASHFQFLAAAFFMFLPAGLLTDIGRLGGNGSGRLAANARFSGGIAMAYLLAMRHGLRWMLLVIAAHLVLVSQFERIFGPIGAPLSGQALQARLAFDVNVSTTAILISFLIISQL